MSHRSQRFMALSFAATLGVVAIESKAVEITHDGSTVVFRDDFESGTPGELWDNGTQPGNWLLSGDPRVVNSGVPGAFTGSQYGFISRDPANGHFSTARAQFADVGTGRLDLDTMVYIPGTQNYLSVVLGYNLSSNPPTPDPSLHSYVTFALNHKLTEFTQNYVPDMGFFYKNDEWMRLQIGYDYNDVATGYTVRLTTTDGSFLYTAPIEHSESPINTMLLKFEDNAQSAYFDAVTGGAPPTPQWFQDASGSWHTVNNWTGGVPNGVDATASFLGAITAPRNILIDEPATVGTLRFDNANRYHLTGLSTLRIEVSSGSGLIDVVQGDQKINLPLTFASSTNVNVATGATLTIADPATISAGKTVTKNGNLLIQAPLTIEAGASLVLASGPTQLFAMPSLGAGSKIDVKNTSLRIDYRGQTSPAGTVTAQLASGYASGAWNGDGINTSSAVAGQTALGWKDDAATQSILVKYTYYGDANLDGQVDISDLGALATAWQTSAVWSQGDFDYSGFVDISDLGKLATNWQLGVGNPLGPSFDEALASVGLAGVSVPEPAGLGVIGLMAFAFRRRRL